MGENFEDKMARRCVEQYRGVDADDVFSVQAKLAELREVECCDSGCHVCIIDVIGEFERHLRNLLKDVKKCTK